MSVCDHHDGDNEDGVNNDGDYDDGDDRVSELWEHGNLVPIKWLKIGKNSIKNFYFGTKKASRGDFQEYIPLSVLTTFLVKFIN